MAQTDFDILEYLASQRGKSAATLYAESGGKAFTEISNELTDGKGFNIIRDVNGHAIGAINNSTGEILGNLSSGTTYGTAAETTASGYNIVTTATTTADEAAGTIKTELASGANEAATSAAGKAGATLSGVTMQTAIFSGIAALGGVAKGVKWYRNNPDFWESLSHKLLPFAYGDKYGDGSSDSWGDIFEKATIPTAVGADGKTYLQEDLLNTLAQELIAGGIYTTEYTPTERPTEISGTVTLDPPTLNQWAGFGGMYSAIVNEIAKDKNKDFLKPDYNTPCVLEVFDAYENKLYICPWALTKREIAYKNLNNNGSYDTDKNLYFGKRIIENGFVTYNLLTGDTTTGSGGGRGYQNVGAFTDLDIARVIANSNKWFICPSGFVQRSPIDGTTPESGATYPQKDIPISETYPDWYSRALQTLDPESTPNNPTYNYWYPVSIQNEPDSDGKTEGSNTTDSQADAQTGNNPNSTISPDTMTAAQEKIAEALKELTKILTKQKIDTPTDTPTDTGETPTPIPPIISGSSNGLWAIYNPTESQLQSFGKWLWSSDIIDQIVKMISNPMDAIIGLHTIYVTPPTGGTATIKAGYLDSGVSSKKVSNQYTNIDCGSITVPEKYQNALDYDYTRVSIYLPFIGIVPLNTRDVMGASLHLTYRVDVLTGTCLAQIRVTKQNSNAVLYTYSGNCAVQIPLTSGNYGTLLTGLLSAVGGVVASVASGGAALPAVAGIGSAALNSHTNVSQSGNLGSNAGALGIRKPYVIITRPIPYNAENYPSFYGIPSQKYVMLGNVSGFTKVREIHVENINATNEEKSEIETLLKGGIIL